MPGLTGIIRFEPYHQIDQDLDSMLRAMKYNNRYSHGRFIDEECGLRIGWTAHPGSFAEGMPVVSRDGNTVMIFTGETFEESGSITHSRSSTSDNGTSKASYLLQLYEEFGEQFFAQLNGWFAGVIIDRRLKRITLFNDRYGMGRIYFHKGPDEFLFASEAKALLKIRPALRVVDPERLAEYLRYNCVLRDGTLFRGISLLPKASAWSFERNSCPRRRQYFEFSEWENQPRLEEEPFYGEWADTVARVFPRYAREDGKVALSSTAGLDMRLIMAALRDQINKLPSYTFNGAWRELLDVSSSRKTASVYHQTHQIISIDGQFLRDFADYAARAVHISDGTHDAFGAHDVFFNEIAREIAPIRLTGKFGSEIVRIRRLVPSSTYAPGFLRDELRTLVDQLPTFANTNPSGNPLTRVVTEEIPWHEHARVAVEQSQLVLRTPYMDNELVKLMYRAPSGSRTAGDLQERYVRDRAPEFAQSITNMGRFTSRHPLATRLYHYAFWALMKVEYTYLYATPHWFTWLDRKLERWHLERLLSGRQKWEGYRIWIKTAFAPFLRETLCDPQAEYTSFLDYRTVSRMVYRHIAGTHNYLDEINKALTLQLIFSSLLRESNS
jgi:asparagine synthase (glutamine-hydrolysing)